MVATKFANDTEVKENIERDLENIEKYAHYVDMAQNEQRILAGRPSIALCGKVWKSSFNAEGFPLCPRCRELYKKIMGVYPPA